MIAERALESAGTEVLRPRHLSSPEFQTELGKKVFSNITEYLSAHERFATQSKVYQKVQGRFLHLFAESKVELLVVNDKEPNAFATPGYMVVSNGLLRLIEGEEELDVVIAHEMTHLEHEHVEYGLDSGSFIKRIGRTRIHETEADLRPLEFLDKKGVNPYGFIKLFEHLEEYQVLKKQELGEHLIKIDPRSKAYHDKWMEAHGDAEHGSLLDRRLNFSQTSWFIDIRNLSLDLKAFDLNEDELNDYETDEVVANRFDSLDSTEKRIFLKRQFRKYTQDPQTEAEDEKRGFAKLRGFIENQKKLIDEIFSDFSKDKKSTMFLFTLQSDCKIHYQTLQKVPSIADLVNEWDSSLSHPASITGFVEVGNNPELEKVGFDNNSEAAESLRLEMLNRYLAKQGIISPGSFLDLYDQVNSLSPVTFADAVNLLFEKLSEKNQFNPDLVWVLSDLLRDRPLKNLDIHLDYEAFLIEQGEIDVSSLDYGSKKIPAEILLIDDLEAKRLAKLRTLKDPFEFFKYLDVWYEPGSGVGRAKQKAVSDLINEQFKYKLEILINQVKGRLNKPDQRDRVLFLGEGTFNRVLSEYFLQLTDQFEDQGDEKLTQHKLHYFLELIGLTQSRENMVRMINSALAVADFKNISSSGVESILTSINEAALAGGIYPGKEIPPIQLSKIPKLVQVAKIVFLNEAAKSGNLRKLRKYISLFPSYNVQPTKALVREVSGSDESYEEVFDELGYEWESRLKKVEIDTKGNWEILTQKILNDKSLEPQSRLAMLMFLSSSSESPQVLLQVVPEIALRMVKGVDFREGVSIVFEKYPTLPQHVFSKALNYLIEEKARTAADFDLLEEKVKASIEGFVSDEESLGVLAIADAFILEPAKGSERNLYNEGLSFINAKVFDPLELMQSLLVFESDERLKKYLFDRWWISNQHGANADSAHRKIFNLNEYFSQKNAQNTLEHWKNEIPLDSEYKSLHEVISDVYLMDTVMKFALLRKALTGTSGVFATDPGKERFAEFVSESMLTSEGGDLDFTRDMITSFFKAGDQEELFDRTSLVIADLMLSMPEQTYRYDKMAVEYAKQFLIFAQSKGDYRFRIPAEVIEHMKNVATKIYKLVGSPASKSESGTVLEISSNLRLLEQFQESNGHNELKKFTPWDLAITVGQKSGALGVRMLQLAGQYFDIPLEQREALDDVYDQNIGQSRLQAYRTLRREAEISPDIARFLENVEEFRPRIGGGSLMTVYEFKMKDGTREAVAVRNPNVTFHLDKTIALLKKTLTVARAKNPQDQNYQLIEVLLDDVSDWIKDELADPDFEIKDHLFRLQNDGWYPESNSNKKILVPESLPTGTRWVRRDRLIPGKNLTGLKVAEETDIAGGKISQEDMRHTTSLIVKNFITQLFETGLVHPDLHPGNIRVTPDGTQVAIFDRYNLLKLSDGDKEFMRGLIAASAFGVGAIQEQLGNYLFSLDENVGKVSQKDQMLSEVERIFRSHSNSEGGLTSVMVYLKRSGVIVPRRISLIAKNLYSLNNLSRTSGFNSLVEAYMVT